MYKKATDAANRLKRKALQAEVVELKCALEAADVVLDDKDEQIRLLQENVVFSKAKVKGLYILLDEEEDRAKRYKKKAKKCRSKHIRDNTAFELEIQRLRGKGKRNRQVARDWSDSVYDLIQKIMEEQSIEAKPVPTLK